MKKFVSIGALLILSISLISCSGGNFQDTSKLFKTNPTTIKWKDSSVGAESCSTNVKVYSKDSRSGQGMVQSNEYKMTLKKINDVQYVRLDYSDSFNNGTKKSIVSNDEEFVIFDTVTEQVSLKGKYDEPEYNQLDFLTANPITGKLKVGEIKENAKKLSFDLNTDSNGVSIISIPQELLGKYNGSTIISTKITMDEVSETLIETEVVTVEQDGSIVTITQIPVYDEYEENYVKVGSITIIDLQDPNKIEGLLTDYEVFNSVDDIPEISKKELAELKKTNSVVEKQDIQLGDPCDLSYTQTIVELYEYVDINNVDDSQFKLLNGGL